MSSTSLTPSPFPMNGEGGKPLSEWSRNDIGEIAARVKQIPKEIRKLERVIGGIRSDKRGDKEALDRMKNEILDNMRLDPSHAYNLAKNAKEREMIAKAELDCDQHYLKLEDQLNSRQAKIDQLVGELSSLEQENKSYCAILEAYHADVIMQTQRERMLADFALATPGRGSA